MLEDSNDAFVIFGYVHIGIFQVEITSLAITGSEVLVVSAVMADWSSESGIVSVVMAGCSSGSGMVLVMLTGCSSGSGLVSVVMTGGSSRSGMVVMADCCSGSGMASVVVTGCSSGSGRLRSGGSMVLSEVAGATALGRQYILVSEKSNLSCGKARIL